MATKFNKGDTVILKSGGPLMTVNGYKRFMNPDTGKWGESTEEVECYWFDGTVKFSDYFHEETLVIEEIEE